MRLDIDSLHVESFAAASSGDVTVNDSGPSEGDSLCWGCSDTGIPSCEINMCEPEDVPDTYFAPCTIRNLTCVGCA